jgi:hypothetical protein
VQQTLLRVAAGVTVQTVQVPLPLRITGLPADIKPVMTTLDRPERSAGPSTSWVFGIILAKGSSSFSVTVKPIPPVPTAPEPQPTEEVGQGAPPGYQQDPPTCTTDQGLQVCVTGHDLLAAVGGATGLLAKTTLFGLDDSKWTTKVLD